MQVDPLGRNVQGITALLAFIALNVIYLVTCLPIITIGVATSSLFEVTMRYADEERGNLIKDYFVAMGRNLRQATAVYLALGVPVFLLAFAAAFWFSFESQLSSIAGMVAAVAAAYLLAALMYGLALVAAYTNTTRQTLKNAMLLPVAQAWRTTILLAIPVTCFALSFVMTGFIYLLLTLGFSLGAYAAAFIFRGAFARHS